MVGWALPKVDGKMCARRYSHGRLPSPSKSVSELPRGNIPTFPPPLRNGEGRWGPHEPMGMRRQVWAQRGCPPPSPPPKRQPRYSISRMRDLASSGQVWEAPANSEGRAGVFHQCQQGPMRERMGVNWSFWDYEGERRLKGVWIIHNCLSFVQWPTGGTQR